MSLILGDILDRVGCKIFSRNELKRRHWRNACDSVGVKLLWPYTSMFDFLHSLPKWLNRPLFCAWKVISASKIEKSVGGYVTKLLRNHCVYFKILRNLFRRTKIGSYISLLANDRTHQSSICELLVTEKNVNL